MVGRTHRGWPGRGPGRGHGRGGWQQADLPSAEDAAAWLGGRLPDGWFTAAPEVRVDREEILVIGELPALTEEFADDDAGRANRAAAISGRISRFREQTRDERIDIARQAEHKYRRKVAWGARLGGTEELFTTLSVPVMTRLRQPERIVLDTLVDAGVARSRSDALAWAVRLVGQHTEDWLSELRDAMAKVDELRGRGPDGSGTD
ncbi:hypothetical protein [Pseudonocardia acaciae]|uniref:hypothetical protein n=1 Tax=Pseudonocardia acaciae TaxID=551276 RepID=UPI00048ED344|nr:hypothetical protein [Pseudonocardia acaciae]